MNTYRFTARAVSAALFALLIASCSGSHAVPPIAPSTKNGTGGTHAQATSGNSTLALSVDYLKFDTLRTQKTFTATVNTGMVLYASTSNVGAATVSPSSIKIEPNHPATFTVTSVAWGQSTITITNKLGLTVTMYVAVSPWVGRGAPIPASTIPNLWSLYNDEKVTVATLGGDIYAAYAGFEADQSTVATELLAYDPTTNSWENKTAPSPRVAFGLGSLNGKLYALGGGTVIMKEGFPFAVTTVEAYDPSTNAWSSRAPLPIGRDFVNNGVVGLNNTLYALGGDYASQSQPTLMAYSPSANKWSTVGQVPSYYSFDTFRMFAIDGKLYIVNGSEIIIYDPSGRKWTSKTPAQSIGFGSMAVVNNTIYGIEGWTWADLPSVFAYDAATNTWVKANAPTPLPLLSRYLAAVGNTLYLVGRNQCSTAFATFTSCTDQTYSWAP